MTLTEANDSMASQLLPQLHGVLVVNKPKGPSSNRCLMQIKHLGQRKLGHAGTLDPMAEGVLIVLLGQATKISSYLLQGGGKVYSGTLRLGVTTDTYDSEGTVLSEASIDGVTEEMVADDIRSWVSVTEQTVPPYSAAKLSGQPLYRLARRGTMVSRTKSIQISQAELISCELPFVRFRVACSSGTYIRSLAHSLGTRLHCGAVLTELTREYSYPFGLEEAVRLDALLANPALLVRGLRPIREALPDWPCLTVPSMWVPQVMQGKSIPARSLEAHETDASHCILMQDNCELALATRDDTAESVWKVTRGLWNAETL